jgi:hypothetical protein
MLFFWVHLFLHLAYCLLSLSLSLFVLQLCTLLSFRKGVCRLLTCWFGWTVIEDRLIAVRMIYLEKLQHSSLTALFRLSCRMWRSGGICKCPGSFWSTLRWGAVKWIKWCEFFSTACFLLRLISLSWLIFLDVRVLCSPVDIRKLCIILLQLCIKDRSFCVSSLPQTFEQLLKNYSTL